MSRGDPVSDGVGKADPGASAVRQEQLRVSTPGRVLVPRTGAVLAAHPSRVEELARQREYFWLDLVDGDGSELDRFSGMLGLDRRTMAFASRYEERPTVIPHGELALLVMYGALSFITGFFGQNFGYLSNHIRGPMAFWGLGIGAELVAVVIVLVLFRRRKWL
jgi:magnesium transporter